MPTSKIEHEPWCRVHSGQDDGHAETCATEGVDFGSTRPMGHSDEIPDEIPTEWPVGHIVVDQAEGEHEARVLIEYARGRSVGFGRLDLTALRAVRDALADDPEGLRAAIDATLAALDSEVSA